MYEINSCKLTSMLNRFAIVLTFIVLGGCAKSGPTLGPGDNDLLASESETDCGFIQNAYGQRVSWKSKIPIKLKLHTNFPAEHESVLREATQHWNEAAGMTLFVLERAENIIKDYNPTPDQHNAVVWHLKWPEALNKKFQGLTSLNWRENQLYEADVAINNETFNFFTGSAPTTLADVHLKSLLVHELGHVLGLKHRSTVPSVMWAVLNGGSVRDTLTDADRATLKCEY